MGRRGRREFQDEKYGVEPARAIKFNVQPLDRRRGAKAVGGICNRVAEATESSRELERGRSQRATSARWVSTMASKLRNSAIPSSAPGAPSESARGAPSAPFANLDRIFDVRQRTSTPAPVAMTMWHACCSCLPKGATSYSEWIGGSKLGTTRHGDITNVGVLASGQARCSTSWLSAAAI